MKRFFFYKRRLPHWRNEGEIYFVTWRVYRAQFDLQPSERDLVVSAIQHFNGERYRVHAYVVMNDHVHVLMNLIAQHKLEKVVHSWKSFTANKPQRTSARCGALWQDEYFDRIVRDEAEYQEKLTYTVENPWKRWPDLDEYPWVGFAGMETSSPSLEELV